MRPTFAGPVSSTSSYKATHDSGKFAGESSTNYVI